jgi:hypothetical protein
VTIANGNEIMLRWEDLDNALNDPHMAVDDVQVLFHFDNTCMITLPIELLGIEASADGVFDVIRWSTSSERDNDLFTVSSSSDGVEWADVAVVDGAGNSTLTNSYETRTEGKLGTTYYRLSQTDYDGKVSLCGIVSIHRKVKGPGQYLDLTGRPCNDCKGPTIVKYPDGSTELIYK